MSGRKVKLLLVHCFPLLASLKSQTLLVQGTLHYFYCLDSRVDILFCLNFRLLWRLKAACRIRFCLSRLCTACRGRVWLTILLDSGKCGGCEQLAEVGFGGEFCCTLGSWEGCEQFAGSVFGSKFCWTRWTAAEVVNSLQQ